MRKSIETNKILFVFLIICSLAFIIGVIYGIADFNKSKTTYDELEYREYTFIKSTITRKAVISSILPSRGKTKLYA